MKRILLPLAILLSIAAQANENNNIAQANDTIITTTYTVTEVNKTTNDTIVKTTVKEEVRRVLTEEDSYIIDGDNNKVTFFWDVAKKDKNKKKLKAHWSGFAMGFINYDDKDIPHGGLNSSASFNFSFNFLSMSKRLGQSDFLLYTGLGTEWAKYKFKDNAALTEVDGVTQFVPAPEGVGYVSSKMTIYHISVPLMLEYQVSSFHISAGAMALFKWHSKSQTRYYENVDGHEIRHKETQGRDLNIRPVNLRLKAQVGVKSLALFATYDPISMFKGDKGPKLHSYAIGGMLCF